MNIKAPRYMTSNKSSPSENVDVEFIFKFKTKKGKILHKKLKSKFPSTLFDKKDSKKIKCAAQKTFLRVKTERYLRFFGKDTIFQKLKTFIRHILRRKGGKLKTLIFCQNNFLSPLIRALFKGNGTVNLNEKKFNSVFCRKFGKRNVDNSITNIFSEYY